MADAPTLLKVLLTERHLQPYETFCREYEKTARRIDPALVATAPCQEQYQRWLSGQVKTKPHPHHCRVLERMFPGRTVGELFTPYNRPERGVAHDKKSVTERRGVCQLGGTAMAGVLFDRLWTEPARLHEALDTTTASPARLAELQREAADLGVRVVREPPATLVEETLMRFREARKLAAKKQNFAMRREIVRCAAMYATIMGEILFNEGQFSLAHTWYVVARRAALEAGDQYLGDIATAGDTYLATYAPDPRAVLAKVDPRLESKHAASPAIAWLWAFKAKAHAMLGDRDLFESAINKSHKALDASPPGLVQPGIFSFLPEKLAFYEARGLVELERTEEASVAAERAIALYDFSETTEPALVRFEQASAFAQAGEIQEACRVAAGAVLDQHTYHGVTVITRAREFDLLLGPSNCGAIRDWRELLASLRPPHLALAAGTEEYSLMHNERALLEHYVQAGKLVQLASLNGDGSPVVCNVWYDAHFVPDVFRFISRYDRQHSQNIRVDGRVAGGIIAVPLEGLGQTVRGVTFAGVARELPIRGVEGEVAAFVARWPRAEAALSPEKPVCGEIPTRLYEVAVNEWVLFDEANFPERPRRVIEAAR